MIIDNIYCMDCLEGMRQMESGSVSLIIADPPYELQQHTAQEHSDERTANIIKASTICRAV
jgi:site-specific DNA-methyltransferase (adenine-specific)